MTKYWKLKSCANVGKTRKLNSSSLLTWKGQCSFVLFFKTVHLPCDLIPLLLGH